MQELLSLGTGFPFWAPNVHTCPLGLVDGALVAHPTVFLQPWFTEVIDRSYISIWDLSSNHMKTDSAVCLYPGIYSMFPS